MRQKVIHIASMAINFVVFAMVLVSWIMMMVSTGQDNLSAQGMGSLRYFTVLSNLFAGLVSLIFFVFQSVSLIKKENKVNGGLIALAHMATVSITITFLVVVCFLAPTAKEGYFSMFSGSNFFFHLIVPILVMVNFFCFENEPSMRWIYTPYAILPVLLYGLFYILNYENHWTVGADENYDWYGFIGDGSVGHILLIAVLFLVGTYLLGLLIFLVNHALQHVIRGYDEDEGVEIEVDETNKMESEDEPDKDEIILDDKVIAHVDGQFIPEGKQVEETSLDSETKEVKETFSTETGTIHVITKQVRKQRKNSSTKTNLTATRPDNKYKDGTRTYHISKHLLSGTWQVKLANGEKAIRTFRTQKEAIDYAKGLVRTQGGSIRVHSKKGSIRKD